MRETSCITSITIIKGTYTQVEIYLNWTEIGKMKIAQKNHILVGNLQNLLLLVLLLNYIGFENDKNF